MNDCMNKPINEQMQEIFEIRPAREWTRVDILQTTEIYFSE